MIDTVILQIPMPRFEIMHPEMFSPSADMILKKRYLFGGRGYFCCIQNRAPQCGIYFPKLTLTVHRARGGIKGGLSIEFSAPKLFFGNNLEEFTNDDFSAVACSSWRATSSS